jgi:2-desacetyl-2-hydroxyethyl bacteriochlorophyllide A dehydrogenase
VADIVVSLHHLSRKRTSVVPEVVQFTSPGRVELVSCPAEPLRPDAVRVRTWYSGISAGTELTAYRGSNPYLTRSWDAERRLFTDGEPTFGYPVVGWGYSEVGQVVEVGAGARGLAVGDVVHGIWGHRSEAVVPAAALAGRTLPAGADPMTGVFARVGSIALNGLLAAGTRLGEDVAVFGQGVIGLLATRLAVLSGARVLAVDAQPHRLAVARELGAHDLVPADVAGGAGAAVRELTGGGADAAIELSGSTAALHEAIRSVVVTGTVAASGFYQGGADALRLGEEFHHNRVRLVSSQISGTPAELATRWDQPRLVRAFMDQAVRGAVDVGSLVTHVVDAGDVASVFALLDSGDPAVLQAVLRFDGAGSGRAASAGEDAR